MLQASGLQQQQKSARHLKKGLQHETDGARSLDRVHPNSVASAVVNNATTVRVVLSLPRLETGEAGAAAKNGDDGGKTEDEKTASYHGQYEKSVKRCRGLHLHRSVRKFTEGVDVAGGPGFLSALVTPRYGAVVDLALGPPPGEPSSTPPVVEGCAFQVGVAHLLTLQLRSAILSSVVPRRAGPTALGTRPYVFLVDDNGGDSCGLRWRVRCGLRHDR